MGAIDEFLGKTVIIVVNNGEEDFRIEGTLLREERDFLVLKDIHMEDDSYIFHYKIGVINKNYVQSVKISSKPLKSHVFEEYRSEVMSWFYWMLSSEFGIIIGIAGVLVGKLLMGMFAYC
ncbi:hypothetical protein AciM339_1424 [Aciduliprofundum sp. MAR08-339]|uniref:hypothetical protein n=1 Tax=Aciduliprofundum sp. (strain MAR08-339) TaxID=673860 RepID=UPI0002A49B29|nr:hypothetical protein AciM339_1424 [Aciduliprofundum sp. MAR08-339]